MRQLNAVKDYFKA